MISISPQLKSFTSALHGDWVRRFERNLWEGTISCEEQFVVLIFIVKATEMFWAKSLPSTNSSLDLTFDLYPTSNTEPCFQLHYFCGNGAFIQNVTAKLVDRQHRPPILAPKTFRTGFIIPLANVLPGLQLSFMCFAKSDVIVRRRYVWGLKSRFLDSLDSPWREVLAKGRSGTAQWKAVS